MKNSIKAKKIICMILTAILLILGSRVYAADSLSTALGVSNSSVKRGDNVTITIGISSIAIESGEKGIGAYTAGLDFDSSVLEYVSTEGTDKWEAPFYQDKLIAGNTDDGKVINTNQSIGTITFKVKDNAKLGTTTIKLTKFSASNGESDITANDATVTITITDGNGNSGSGNSGITGGSGAGSGNGSGTITGGNGSGSTSNGSGSTGGNTNTQNSGSNNSSNVSSNNDGTKQGTLPKTGYSNIAIYTLIGVLTLAAVYFGIRMKSIKNN